MANTSTDQAQIAYARFDYIEIFHNRQRRQPALGYRTVIEYVPRSRNDTVPV